MGGAHIDLLACSLAKICPDLIPSLERMYHVDFRGSIDDTGNAGMGNWTMETDNNYNIVPDYFNKEQL